MRNLLLATVAIGALAFSGQAFAGASGSVAASSGGTFTGAIGFATTSVANSVSGAANLSGHGNSVSVAGQANGSAVATGLGAGVAGSSANSFAAGFSVH